MSDLDSNLDVCEAGPRCIIITILQSPLIEPPTNCAVFWIYRGIHKSRHVTCIVLQLQQAGVVLYCFRDGHTTCKVIVELLATFGCSREKQQSSGGVHRMIVYVINLSQGRKATLKYRQENKLIT